MESSSFQLADYIFEHEPNFTPSISSFSSLLLSLCVTDAASRHGNMEEIARLDKEFLEVMRCEIEWSMILTVMRL
jgi:hypothetical protein